VRPSKWIDAFAAIARIPISPAREAWPKDQNQHRDVVGMEFNGADSIAALRACAAEFGDKVYVSPNATEAERMCGAFFESMRVQM